MLNLTEEEFILSSGHILLGSLDEVGRGPLAGPVVAACILINKNTLETVRNHPVLLKEVRDSKKLTAKKREFLFNIIKETVSYGIGICDHNTIDRINILEATFLAMKKAISDLKEKPDYIILDGKFPIPNFSTPQKAIIKGDASVFSIAAASIMAKVTRDRLMEEYDKKYPGYGFIQHAGYGTKAHLDAIHKFGACPIHRKTFAPLKDLLKS